MMKSKNSNNSKQNTIQSVDRALTILEFIASNNNMYGLTEIARNLELNKATAYGLLSTLEKHNLIEQNPETKKYYLGIYLAELAMKTEDSLDVRKIARPYMKKLALAYTSSTQLGIESDGEVMYIEVSQYNFALPIVCQVNSRLPFYCTGVGKSILAFWTPEQIEVYLKTHKLASKTPKTIVKKSELRKELSLIRERGYAIDDEENQIGVISISAPIFSINGTVIAGISVAIIKATYTEELKNKIVTDLLNYSSKISKEMGYFTGK